MNSYQKKKSIGILAVFGKWVIGLKSGERIPLAEMGHNSRFRLAGDCSMIKFAR
jgi:hypothetical protein